MIRVSPALVRRLIDQGTGLFGLVDADLLPPTLQDETTVHDAVQPCRPWEARHVTWDQAQPALKEIFRAGDDRLTFVVGTLHLAEVSLRIATDAGKPFIGADPDQFRRRLVRWINAAARPSRRSAQALHGMAGRRTRGRPGESRALRIFSAFAAALQRPARRHGGRTIAEVPWTLLLALQEAIFPPLLTGRRVDVEERRRRRARAGEASPASALLAPGDRLRVAATDRLRFAVIADRRRRKRTGRDDLRALRTEFTRLERRLGWR